MSNRHGVARSQPEKEKAAGGGGLMRCESARQLASADMISPNSSQLSPLKRWSWTA